MAKIIQILIFIGSLAIVANAISQQNVEGTKVLPGKDAAIGYFPFIASIWEFPSKNFLCAGAIIGKKWILTSAQCINSYTSGNSSTVRVTVGGVQIVVIEPGEEDMVASKLWIHPDFETRRSGESGRLDQNYYNNIALIELRTNIPPPNSQIAAALLAEADDVLVPGDTVVIAGWGGITETLPINNLQYSTNLHLMTNADCAKAVPGTIFDKYHICTAPYPDATACKYDHGGPLFKSDPVKGPVILGVINYAPCWDSGHPTVYASVSAHRDWITRITGITARS